MADGKHKSFANFSAHFVTITFKWRLWNFLADTSSGVRRGDASRCFKLMCLVRPRCDLQTFWHWLHWKMTRFSSCDVISVTTLSTCWLYMVTIQKATIDKHKQVIKVITGKKIFIASHVLWNLVHSVRTVEDTFKLICENNEKTAKTAVASRLSISCDYG